MQPEPLEDRADGGDRHVELDRDPRRRYPQPAQLLDEPFDPHRGATRHPTWR
jgi:hypothetical protein